MSERRKIIIGVMGAAQCDAKVYQEAYQVGRLVAEGGAILLCGGRGGVMEASAKGAKEAGGLTIGILPGSNERDSPPNPYIDIAIFTGLSDARNAINVRSSEVIIAISGGYGTLSEIALALKIGKPVVLLHSWNFESETIKSEPLVRIAQTPEEAVAQAFEITRQGKV